MHGTASDIWAMGVTLYCMLTGHLPWQHVEVLEMYRAIEHDVCVTATLGWLTRAACGYRLRWIATPPT